jgi:hypothetical protein
MRGLLFGGDRSCNCVVDMEMYRGLSLETDQFDHSICLALALQLQGLPPQWRGTDNHSSTSAISAITCWYCCDIRLVNYSGWLRFFFTPPCVIRVNQFHPSFITIESLREKPWTLSWNNYYTAPNCTAWAGIRNWFALITHAPSKREQLMLFSGGCLHWQRPRSTGLLMLTLQIEDPIISSRG